MIRFGRVKNSETLCGFCRLLVTFYRKTWLTVGNSYGVLSFALIIDRKRIIFLPPVKFPRPLSCQCIDSFLAQVARIAFLLFDTTNPRDSDLYVTKIALLRSNDYPCRFYRLQINRREAKPIAFTFWKFLDSGAAHERFASREFQSRWNFNGGNNFYSIDSIDSTGE